MSFSKSVDRDRPGSWVPYKKSLCTQCTAQCCTMPVEAKFPDLVRLGLAAEDEAEFDMDALVRRLKKEKIVRFYREKTGIFILETRNGDDCLFLDTKTRLCTVYDKRPDVCRGFPEKLGSRVGWCPYMPKPKPRTKRD